MYTKTIWKDRVTEYEGRYTETPNGDGTNTYTEAPGEVLQEGTPQDAIHFNNNEDGTAENAAIADLLYTQIMLLLGHAGFTLEELEESKLGKTEKAADANKADKLGTARAIALSGGATGTATPFDGTGNITIPVTAIDPAKLSAAVSVSKGGTGASDAQGARESLSVPEIKELNALITLFEAAESIHQAETRAADERISLLEAQIEAMA